MKTRIGYAFQQITRTDEEIQAVLDECLNPSGRFSGMSYEDGISAAINWITGHTTDGPLE